jgi:hypothetical protein
MGAGYTVWCSTSASIDSTPFPIIVVSSTNHVNLFVGVGHKIVCLTFQLSDFSMEESTLTVVAKNNCHSKRSAVCRLKYGPPCLVICFVRPAPNERNWHFQNSSSHNWSTTNGVSSTHASFVQLMAGTSVRQMINSFSQLK